MRITLKSFTLALALTTVLSASSAAAATHLAKTQSRDDHGPAEPNPIVRLINSIKHRLAHIYDGIVVNPPEQPPS